TGVSNLYILSSTSATEPATPEATNTGSTDLAISAIAFRQSSNIPSVAIDGIRVANKWSDIMTASTNPSLSISTPTNSQIFTPNTTAVDVTVDVQNFTFSKDNGSGATDSSGDGYLKATLAEQGSSSTVSSFFSANVPDIQVAAGESYTLTIELVDNAGASLSPELKSTTTFSVASFTDVVNIAALRAGTEGDYYRVTGEVTVTYTASNRNQKYIQDATGGILIDDSADIVALGNYVAGDGITNLNGKLGSFGGVFQFVPVSNSGTKSSTGNSVTAVNVTLADLNSNLNDYESEMITISGVTFAAGDGTAVFEASKNYDLSKGTDMLVFRTSFANADFIGNVIPSTAVNITGVASEFNGTAQIFATSAANIVLGLERNSILGFATYPNPVNNGKLNISTNSSDIKEVTIFNVIGKQVFSTSFSGLKSEINISKLNKGLYILKVKEGDNLVAKKLVIE
ncbi:MAG: T9SS type A sorting domain-containing protein, partial [Polaribacter sp.]